MNQNSTELLAELVRMRPVTEDVASVNRVTGKVTELLKAEGLYCTVEDFDGRKCLYASTVEGKVSDYLLNVHLDVVPAEEYQFEPEIKDGLMFGRGPADCLGSAVSVIQALCRLKGNVSVAAIFSTDEETGGSTTAGMVERGYSATISACVIDSAWGSITYAQKGILDILLRAVSPTGGGHSSAPWNFTNPIDMLLDGYQKFRAVWQNPSVDDQWHNTMAACVIRGGSAHNQIPDEATLQLNFRLIDAADREKILALVRETTGLEATELTYCPPVTSDVNNAEITRLREIVRKHLILRNEKADRYAKEPKKVPLDHDVPLIQMNGATDARALVDLNIPIVILGLDGAGVHTAHEYVVLDSIDIMSDILVEYCNG